MSKAAAAGLARRGAATLVTVMLLFFVMALVAAYANRNLIVEQRVSRSFETLGAATEAGHQVAQRLLALLNSDHIDESCRSAADGPGSLRQRMLLIGADGRIELPPAARGEAGAEAPHPLLCDRLRGEDWACQCPLNQRPRPQAEDGGPRESALLRVLPLAGADGIGRFALSLSACAGSSASCLDWRRSTATAVHGLRQFALVRALKMAPVSALVARGDVDLGSGLALVHNEASHGGLALHAGGKLLGDRTQVQGPAGSPPDAALLSEDPPLATLSEAEFFRRHFGLGHDVYAAQPAMRRLLCANDCTAALRTLATAGAQMIWHEGDLALDTALSAGTAAAPVLLLVRGSLRIGGALQWQGLIYSSGDLLWRNADAQPSLVRGALLVGGRVRGEAGAGALFDAATLDALKHRVGSFVPLPGGSSWGGP